MEIKPKKHFIIFGIITLLLTSCSKQSQYTVLLDKVDTTTDRISISYVSDVVLDANVAYYVDYYVDDILEEKDDILSLVKTMAGDWNFDFKVMPVGNMYKHYIRFNIYIDECVILFSMLFNDDSSVIVIGSWTENTSNNLYHHVYDDKNKTLLSLKSYYDKHINEMKEMAIVDPMDSQNEYFFYY